MFLFPNGNIEPKTSTVSQNQTYFLFYNDENKIKLIILDFKSSYPRHFRYSTALPVWLRTFIVLNVKLNIVFQFVYLEISQHAF